MNLSEGRMPMKEPYLMTEAEWNAAREACHPDNMQTNFTRKSGAEATRRFREMRRLCYHVRDADSERLQLAHEGKIVISPDEAEEILGRLRRPVSWPEVREKARSEGKL